MKKVVLLFAVLALAACQSEPPQTTTAEATEAMKKGAKELGAKIEAGAEKVKESEAAKKVQEKTREAADAAGREIKRGAGKAAEAAGEAIAKKGREVQAEAEKKKQ